MLDFYQKSDLHEAVKFLLCQRRQVAKDPDSTFPGYHIHTSDDTCRERLRSTTGAKSKMDCDDLHLSR
jgi:hypothetical protein